MQTPSIQPSHNTPVVLNPAKRCKNTRIYVTWWRLTEDICFCKWCPFWHFIITVQDIRSQVQGATLCPQQSFLEIKRTRSLEISFTNACSQLCICAVGASARRYMCRPCCRFAFPHSNVGVNKRWLSHHLSVHTFTNSRHTRWQPAIKLFFPIVCVYQYQIVWILKRRVLYRDFIGGASTDEMWNMWKIYVV